MTSDERLKDRRQTGLNRPKFAAQRLRPFVFLLGLLAIPLPALALQLTPTYQVLEVAAGGKVEGRLKIVNNHGEDVIITPSVREWVQTKHNKKTAIDEWLKLDKKAFTLKDGESREIEFTALAPKKAKGEMIGMLTFQTKRQEVEVVEGGNITLQVSVAVYVAVTGTEKIAQEVSNVAVNITTNTSIAVTVKNTGNVHTRPKGWVYFYDPEDRLVLNVELESGKPTYPDLTRVYNGKVRGFVLPAGKYTAKIEMRDTDRAITYPVEVRRITVSEDGRAEVR